MLEAQLFTHTNLYRTIVLIINNVKPQKSISKKYFLNVFRISLFFCPWGIISVSAHYIYRNSIVYTKGQESIKVITTFNNSIIDISTNILLILFLLWLVMNQFLGHITFVSGTLKIHVYGNSTCRTLFKGYLNHIYWS